MQKTKSLVNTRELVFIALSVALITLGAYIRISLFIVPFTLQFLFIILISLTFGHKIGVISTIIYALMGLAGLPVFSSGGGIGYVLTAGFGYIASFPIAAFVMGYFARDEKLKKLEKKKATIRAFVFILIGLFIVYICGVSYWYFLVEFVMEKPEVSISLSSIVWKGAIIFIPKDVFFALVAAVISPRLQNIFRN